MKIFTSKSGLIKISLKANENIVVVVEQFPSNIYSWIKKAKDNGSKIKTIYPTEKRPDRGNSRNENILNALDEKTKLVAIANFHWADGILFDPKSIRRQCDKYYTLLVIGGSQSSWSITFLSKRNKV